MRKLLLLSVTLLSTLAFAQKGTEINLWSEGPHTNNGDPQDTAKVVVFLPDEKKATGRAVVCCPGGGYSHLAWEKEGTSWAPFFNGQGIALIVLKYRMPHGNHTIPAEDAEEAIKLVRKNAEEWHINPKDVGIMGFSAGGHLASTVATHATGQAAPDFQILFYPVISMEQGTTHQGSRENLLGKNPNTATSSMSTSTRHVPLSPWLMTTAVCCPSTASTITRNCMPTVFLRPYTSIPLAGMVSASCSRSPTTLR